MQICTKNPEKNPVIVKNGATPKIRNVIVADKNPCFVGDAEVAVAKSANNAWKNSNGESAARYYGFARTVAK